LKRRKAGVVTERTQREKLQILHEKKKGKLKGAIS